LGPVISRTPPPVEFGSKSNDAIINFTTNFKNHGVLTERLTLVNEAGRWQVAAYAILTTAAPSEAAAAAPTFNKDVAPILFKNCTKCHSPDEIASRAPFLSYDAVRPWARAIKEKVLRREMPPWPADPNASLKFRNDARLSQRDIDTLVAWVNAGAPKGDGDLPPLPNHEHGWLHPKGIPPDVVISLPRDFEVPAKGEIPYIRILAKVPYLEDKWVVASQVRPSNGAVVHHMAITELELPSWVNPADPGASALLARQLGLPNGNFPTRPAVTDPSNPAAFDMLGVYTPGTTFEMYGDDTAKLLKGGKNLYLNFNIHYTTTGKPEKDRSSIALWFQPRPPKHQLFRVASAVDSIIAEGKELLTDAPGEKAEGSSVAIPPIPPYAANYEVIGITAYTAPVTIYQFQPHAHLRGKDFKYAVVYPDGHEQTVLSVPKYDFNWQLAYELETPLKLPAGSKLVVTAHYDNSQNNKEVYFRAENQSWDEMFTPFIQYSIDSHDPTVEIVKVEGCLEQSRAKMWMLTNAGHPALELLGASVFNPALHKGHKVAVKGALIHNRLNVTSLQSLAPACQ